jgi:hypothetical protein
MNVLIILSSGLAKRVKPISSVVPKVLMNYGHDTILKGLVETYSEYGLDKTFVVVSSSAQELTQEYITKFSLPVEVVVYDAANGTNDTILDLIRLTGLSTSDNVVFNWGDIVPQFAGGTNPFNENQVFTYGDQCRFKAEQDRGVFLCDSGNVVGVYSFSPAYTLKGLKRSGKEEDIADAFDFSKFKITELEGLHDVGDFNKLDQLGEVQSRGFNDVKILQDTVVKTSTNTELAILESMWYDRATELSIPNVPKKLSFTTSAGTSKLVLERVHGETLDVRHSPEDILEYIAELDASRHRFTSDPVHVDFKLEAEKVWQRTCTARKIYSSVTAINDLKIDNPETLINRAIEFITVEERIKASADTKYGFFHGDLNLSNTIIDENRDFWMIDPRGYFGSTELAGPFEYELAKVLYGLSGYCKFNKDLSYRGFESLGNGKFRIEVQTLELFEDVYDASTPAIKLWLGMIWLCLSEYFSNNPYKSMAAYINGLYHLQKTFNELKDEL